MENVFAALLLTDPAIKDLVGFNVDWDVSAQGAVGPRIILHLVSEQREYTFQGDDGLRDALVQIDCRANTALERRQLVEAVDNFLSGYRGTFHGVSFRGAFKAGKRTRFDMDGGTRWFQAQMDYRIWWAKA